MRFAELRSRHAARLWFDYVEPHFFHGLLLRINHGENVRQYLRARREAAEKMSEAASLVPDVRR